MMYVYIAIGGIVAGLIVAVIVMAKIIKKKNIQLQNEKQTSATYKSMYAELETKCSKLAEIIKKIKERENEKVDIPDDIAVLISKLQ